VLIPGDLLDFEDGPDGLASPNNRWQHGVIASGPGLGASGTQGWATNLAGSHGNNWREFLYLPPIELDPDDDALLTFALWVNAGSGDGLSVERLTSAGDWATITPITPAYDSTAIGIPAWRIQRDDLEYVPAEFALAPYAGQTVLLRFAFRSNSVSVSSGAYIDDLSIQLVE
jgi:large repetitive protein